MTQNKHVVSGLISTDLEKLEEEVEVKYYWNSAGNSLTYPTWECYVRLFDDTRAAIREHFKTWK